MKGSRRLLLAMVCLCSAVILAGCSNYSGLRIGWVGSDSHTSMKAKDL